MVAETPLQRLDRLLARGLPRQVRANAARPQPPPNRVVHPMAQMRLIVALEGRKEEIFGDGEALQHWAMQAGDVLLVRPDTWLAPIFETRHRHFGAILGATDVRTTWTRCDGRADLPQPLVTEATLAAPMPAQSALKQAADALCALDVTAEQEAARHLVLTFLHLLRSAASRPRAPETKGERTWRQMIGFLHDNCHLAIGREEVARALGLSPSYVSRLCRARGGRSFIDLLTELRLERAAAMLRTVDLPIGGVGRACGFADAGYFIRRFRRGFGATPGAYRREHGRATAEDKRA